MPASHPLLSFYQNVPLHQGLSRSSSGPHIPGDLILFPPLKCPGLCPGKGEQGGTGFHQPWQTLPQAPGQQREVLPCSTWPEGGAETDEGRTKDLAASRAGQGRPLCSTRQTHQPVTVSRLWWWGLLLLGFSGASVCPSLLRGAGSDRKLPAGRATACQLLCQMLSAMMGVFDSGLIDNCLVGSGVSGLGVRSG